jgi:hypothetical protein
VWFSFTPGHWVPFMPSPTIRRDTVELFWPASTPKSKPRYNWRSVSMSRYRAHSETCDQILLSVRKLLSESCCLVSVGRPPWREVVPVICHSQSIVIYQYSHQAFTLHVFYSSAICVQYIQSFIQALLSTADYALLVIISSNIPQ